MTSPADPPPPVPGDPGPAVPPQPAALVPPPPPDPATAVVPTPPPALLPSALLPSALLPPAPPKSGGVWITVGIIVAALSLFSLPRGLSLTLLSIVRPGAYSTPYALGIAFFGAALLAGGILLIVRGVRIRRANRAAVYAEADRLEREAG